MIQKPREITRAGVAQLLLAGSFVVWLLGFPAAGVFFAWPVKPAETAMFLGAGFICRAYIGYCLWRERDWGALRWQVPANYAFLAAVWLATLWHVDEMSWRSHIWMAHIWVLAYTIEPVVLFLWEPRVADAPPPAVLRQGPVMPGLKTVALAGLVVSVTLAGLMMINPGFMNTRWPWPLDPFDCRVMSAFFALTSGWCYTIYFGEDWAETKKAVRGLGLFAIAQLGVWAALARHFDPGRNNRWQYGVILAFFLAALVYYFVRQERARRSLADAVVVTTSPMDQPR